MKKNLILGLFLFAVIFIGAIMMVSALKGCYSGSDPNSATCSQCTIDTSCTSSGCSWNDEKDKCTSSALFIDDKTKTLGKPGAGVSVGPAPRGWTPVERADGQGECYLPPSAIKEKRLSFLTKGRAKSPACTDSDGNNIYNKGFVTVGTSPKQFDSCLSSAKVNELICDKKGKFKESPLNCPAGSLCSDGACNQVTPTETSGTPSN